MNAEMRVALRPLVEPARVELRDMEVDRVPHKLRAVVKSSARKLPPHLERTLLDALAKSADLRDAVGDRWRTGGGSDELIEEFLADPSLAVSKGDALADDAELGALRSKIEALEDDRTVLQAALDEAKARIAADRKTFEASLKDQKTADKRARAGLAARTRAAETAHADSSERIAELESQLDRSAERVAELEGELERMRDLRSQGPSSTPVDRSPERPVVPSDPIELARWLDIEERTMRPFREAASTRRERTERSSHLKVPEGVSPDQVEALAALVDQGPSLVVVDGYNLAGVLGLTPLHSAASRAAVITIASSIKRRSGGDVTVVFDAVGIDGRSGFVSDSGVRVVFSKDHLADDEIVRLVEQATGGVVVVTDDRDVRERASRRGAVTLWSAAAAPGSKP